MNTWLFPGQGSQVVGMGNEFYQSFDIVKKIFEEADSKLNFPISKLILEGPENDLQLTKNTQPAILSDKIINFDPNSDKIGFGSVTASTENFLSATGASSFLDALTEANTAMSAGKIYYFSYNVASATDGFGLLFNDIDGDGSSDTFLTLTGITTDVISHQNLIIA